jgi:preprotein translocase subunit SecG
MEIFITIIHVLVALFMILVVLIQGGNAGGVGAAFGGGNSSGLFGASGANKFLTRLTYGAAGIFVFTSIMLTVMQGRAAKTGLLEKLQSSSTAPAELAPPSDAAAPVAPNEPAAPAPINAAPAPESAPNK